MKDLQIVWLFIVFFAIGSLHAQNITILHTNDMHSRITGDGPEIDYTPMIINNDSVLGGFARLATLLKQQKSTNPNGTLILDAGDFLMGTLFNTIEPQTGFQLSLMKQMGIQFTTIGNHEFDYGPNALAQAIQAAEKRGGLPQIISTNLNPVPDAPKDGQLAKLFANKTILPYKIIEVKGVKIGIIGILGKDAAEVAPLKAPVQVAKQSKTARKTAKMLKKEKHVDLVICLSHSGVYSDGKGGFYGEDVKMAKKAKYIDVIISGHTHVVTPQPVKVKNTLIVQTGCYLHNLGRLDLTIKNGKIAAYHYRLIPIDDRILGDAKVNDEINRYKSQINKKILNRQHLYYRQPVAETSFNLMKHNKRGYQHTNLGVFLTQAIQHDVNRYGDSTDVELLASGTIRDNILEGKTGVITVPDIFRVLSLGRVNDSLPGYPLAKIYITGHELKNLMEVLLLSKSDDGYVFVSGAKVYYNPKKVMLHKVYKIEINGKLIDLSKKNPKLYSITADTYLLSFLGRVKKLSHGLVSVVPKDAHGNPVTNMNTALIDFNKNKKGIQPGTEWLAVIHYLQQLKDKNNDGIPDIPLQYEKPLSHRIAGKKGN